MLELSFLHCPNTLPIVFFFFFFFWVYLFIYFMAVLGLRLCARAFSSCGKWGPLFIAVRGPLIIAASLLAEHRLQTRRLSNCGSRAQLLRGTWDPPRPGLEPALPALAGRFSTTAPPGKPCPLFLLDCLFSYYCTEDFFYILETSYQIFVLQIFSPSLWLVFTFS